MPKNSLIYASQEIVEKTEAFLCSQKHQNEKLTSTSKNVFIKRIDVFLERLIRSFIFLSLGVDDVFLPFKRFIVRCLVLIIILIVINLLNPFESLSENIYSIFIAVLLLIFFISFFSTPSNYIKKNLDPLVIMGILKIIKSQDVIKTTEDIELLEQCFEIFQARAKRHINTYKWIIGSATTILFFITNITSRFYNPFIDNLPMSTNLISTIVLTFLFLLLIAIVISCYQRAHEIIFLSIKLSLIEYKSTLLKISSK